jgi:hypothetical protein
MSASYLRTPRPHKRTRDLPRAPARHRGGPETKRGAPERALGRGGSAITAFAWLPDSDVWDPPLQSRVRNGLAAGGRWIRTLGPP